MPKLHLTLRKSENSAEHAAMLQAKTEAPDATDADHAALAAHAEAYSEPYGHVSPEMSQEDCEALREFARSHVCPHIEVEVVTDPATGEVVEETRTEHKSWGTGKPGTPVEIWDDLTVISDEINDVAIV